MKTFLLRFAKTFVPQKKVIMNLKSPTIQRDNKKEQIHLKEFC